MRHVEGSAHSNSVSLTPTFKKGVRDLVGSATEQKLATCSVKEGFMTVRAETRESGNTYSRVLFPSKQLHIREPPLIFKPIRPHELKKIKDKICQLIILLKPEKIAHANNAQPPQNVRANKEIIQIQISCKCPNK